LVSEKPEWGEHGGDYGAGLAGEYFREVLYREVIHIKTSQRISVETQQ
jgi:hypothetical protein